MANQANIIDSIVARAEIDSIARKGLSRVGKAWIPMDRIWVLYDPCMTTKWRDEAVASRFQEYLGMKQKKERLEARERPHASVKRRSELLERRCAGNFGILLDMIVNLFAAGLLKELRLVHHMPSTHMPEKDIKDWELLDDHSETQPSSLSGLYAKWSPTPGGMHDKALGMASLIREKLLEKLSEKENGPLREELLRFARHLVQDANPPLECLSYQRDVLTKLREAAEIPEHFIGAGTAKGAVNYCRMSSRCRMIFGEKVFRRLDRQNYDRFIVDAAKFALLKQLRQCEEGKHSKINIGALAPHEVMLSAIEAEASQSAVAKVEAGLQWQALLDSCSQPNTKRLIIPMCDVSGSMSAPCGGGSNGAATCMDVACALSLLLTDLLPEDSMFQGKILTFSDDPEFVDLKRENSDTLTVEAIEKAESLDDIEALLPISLADRVAKLKGSDWDVSTNFFRAMQQICTTALQNNLMADDLQELELVVFSDMEFNEAQYGIDHNQKTMLEKIRQLFVDRFGPKAAANPPKIVFWNLRASVSGSGVVKDTEEESVALLSGVSAGLIRKYLTWDFGPFDSENVHGSGMAKASSSRSSTSVVSAVAQDSSNVQMSPTRAMLKCLADPLYKTLRLEDDLKEWEVHVPEEKVTRRAEKVHGENGELVHKSNSSALVALFFEAVPGIDAPELEELLDAAFKEHPLIALQLLFNLGAVRKHAAGKMDRENFQVGLLWLYKTWPETYLLNVASIAKFASLKELLNSAMFILYECQHECDPDNFALFSLAGQKDALLEHNQRKQHRENKARRKYKKERRLQLWSDFAHSEEANLFGDLRIELEWSKIREKLGDLQENRTIRMKRTYISRRERREVNASIYEESWETKERLATRRAVRLEKKRRKRERLSQQRYGTRCQCKAVGLAEAE